MYAGIGTPRSHHLYIAAKQGGKGLHQLLLHTCPVGLDLPAVVGCAVVG